MVDQWGFSLPIRCFYHNIRNIRSNISSSNVLSLENCLLLMFNVNADVISGMFLPQFQNHLNFTVIRKRTFINNKKKIPFHLNTFANIFLTLSHIPGGHFQITPWFKKGCYHISRCWTSWNNLQILPFLPIVVKFCQIRCSIILIYIPCFGTNNWRTVFHLV